MYRLENGRSNICCQLYRTRLDLKLDKKWYAVMDLKFVLTGDSAGIYAILPGILWDIESNVVVPEMDFYRSSYWSFDVINIPF